MVLTRVLLGVNGPVPNEFIIAFSQLSLCSQKKFILFMLFIYQATEKRCVLRQSFFATQQVAVRFSFVAF